MEKPLHAGQCPAGANAYVDGSDLLLHLQPDLVCSFATMYIGHHRIRVLINPVVGGIFGYQPVDPLQAGAEKAAGAIALGHHIDFRAELSKVIERAGWAIGINDQMAAITPFAGLKGKCAAVVPAGRIDERGFAGYDCALSFGIDNHGSSCSEFDGTGWVFTLEFQVYRLPLTVFEFH